MVNRCRHWQSHTVRHESVSFSPYFPAHIPDDTGGIKAYRGDKLREQLTKQTTITGAIAESGFSSGSRFYESSDTLLV